MLSKWEKVEGAEKTEVLKRINALHNRKQYDSEKTTVSCVCPPFYKKGKIYKAESHTGLQRRVMRFVGTPEKLVKLDGSRESLHDVADLVGFILDKDTVIDYSRYYLGATYNEMGNFKLVDESTEIELAGKDAAKKLEEIQSVLFAPVIIENHDDHIHLKVCILYGNVLFEAEMSVWADGMIDVDSEKTLVENIPTTSIPLI